MLERELLLERELWRRECRTSLAAWCTEALAPFRQTPAAHHRLIIEELEGAASGETDRLMLFLPPGSAKSTYATVLFPPWLMQKGGLDIIGASHGSELAEDFSGRVLRTVAEHSYLLGFNLMNESQKLWRTSNGCVYRAAGARGSITGRRADLFIIDDPIKGREQADSPTVREKVWQWYQAEVITRLKPGARIILIQTRWHPDDLAGRLLQEMEAGADQWRVINLPAIAEENDALGRKPGEPLWPAWEDKAALARKRAAVGEREWAALYQQRPRPMEGSLFKVALIETLDAPPPVTSVVRAWDHASTAQVGTRDPDWTVGLKLGKTPQGRFVVLDIVRLRGGPDEVEAAILATASKDGKDVPIVLPLDPGPASKHLVLYLTRRLAGYRVSSARDSKDKATRAAPVASQCNVGNLAVVRASWNMAFRDELADFPSSSHDDQVDALSSSFTALQNIMPIHRGVPIVVTAPRHWSGM